MSLAILQSTAFSVMPGIRGAIFPKTDKPKPSNLPRDAGTPAPVRSWSLRAERLALRIRRTWSVRSRRRSRPASSASNLDRRVAEAASLREVSARDASSKAKARACASSIKASSEGRSLTVVMEQSNCWQQWLSCVRVCMWMSN